MSETIPIYIGTSPGGEDAEAQMVAEYTIRKYASQPVDITWLALSNDPKSFWHGWNTESWGTPFAGLRFGVAAFRRFQGKAIYVDTDVICRADIAELWNQEIPEGAVALVKDSGPKLRTCIMLMDCAAAKSFLPDIKSMRRTKLQYRQIMKTLGSRPELTRPFAGMWNCVDLKDTDGNANDPRIKLIHYSSQWEQVHLSYASERLAKVGRKHWYNGPTNPHRFSDLQLLFDDVFAEAKSAGYSVSDYEPVVPFGPYQIRSYAYRFADKDNQGFYKR